MHALALFRRVFMLLRLAFLESERRSPILDRGQFVRVHVFKDRLPMMHRDERTGAACAVGDSFRVVPLGPRLQRPDPCQSYLNPARGGAGSKLARHAGGPNHEI